MNERIKELAEQSGLDMKELRSDGTITLYAFEEFDLERFAELVRADERAACAMLCDDFSNTQMIPVKDTWRSGVRMAANTIRDKK